jgi:hypothetical protein
MDKDEIERRLWALPPVASAAFSVRSEMRRMPLFVGPAKGVLARMGLTRQTPFSHWPEELRQRKLFMLFLGQVGSVGVALGSGVWQKHVIANRTFAEPDSSGIYTETVFFAANAAVAGVVRPRVVAGSVAAAASSAATEAVFNIQSTPIFSENRYLKIKKQVETDLKTLETHSAAFLINTPLWQVSPPQLWQDMWALFSRQLLQLDPSFAFWLQWYQDRLDGKHIDLPLLEKWFALPEEVASQSPADVNRYLASLGSAKERLNRVRTIFIGYGDAGKTSLIRTLHGEPVVEGREPMTPGIDIREWDGAGNEIMTHFWDFGGQVMAHATHQFFLRASCLYVLVLSARAEINATEQAEYWLQHVQAFGDNAPVMIVGNKHDQTPVHLDMASLQTKYPNVVGFYPLSCTQAQGAYRHKFQSFLADFRQQLNQLGTRQVMFTTEQFKVLQALRERAAKHAFIAHKEFAALCEQHKVGQNDEAARTFLLDLLDRLGVVIHFKDLPYLSEHVLNPRWLTYGVYKVMYSHRARLSLQDIAALLSQTKVADEGGQELAYPPDKCLFIATAMQRFKLCYPLRHASDQFIIPGLLETDQPPGLKRAGFDKAVALAYKTAFTGFVPRHVMSEMIVERNADIEGELVWQYGVMLQSHDPAARSLVVVDYQARELAIWVQGSGAKDYLLILRNVLLQILTRLTMQTTELIRLPRSALLDQRSAFDALDDWAVYQQIEANLKSGAQSFISAKGLTYDLPKVAGLYVKNAIAQAPTTVSHHYYAGRQNINQAPGGAAGDKSVNIQDSTVYGDITIADQIRSSFNQANQSNTELASALANMLEEIRQLNESVPAAQARHVNTITECFERLLEETQREKPAMRWYQASLDGIKHAALAIGAPAQPLLTLVEKVRAILGA